MGLNYNHLLYFYTAVNSGSLKQAAVKLSLSPSTISEQVQELEGYFGKSLLRRGRGKLELTDHGQTAYQFARVIFTAGERLKRTLLTVPEIQSAPIEIGVNSSVTDLFERRLFMPLFKAEETKIRLRIGELGSLADDLYQYALDIVITDRELKDGRGIKNEIIQKPTYKIVATPTFIKHYGGLDQLNLQDLPFVNYTDYSGVKWEVDQFFMRQGFKPLVIGEVDATSIMKHAVCDDLAYAILPTYVVQEELRTGELVSIGDVPDFDVKVYAYYHEKEPTKHIKSVLEYLREKAIKP